MHSDSVNGGLSRWRLALLMVLLVVFAEPFNLFLCPPTKPAAALLFVAHLDASALFRP